MDFQHTTDRQMLSDTLRRFLAAEVSIGADGTGTRAVWDGLAELGIPAALFDEGAGGFGGSGFDIMVVFEELGRACAATPLLGTLMAGHAIVAGGGHPAIADIVAARSIAAFAHGEAETAEDGAPLKTTARRAGAAWRLTGAKAVVAYADLANVLLVSADADGGRAVFVVPADTPRLSIQGYATIDGAQAGEVRLDDVSVPDDARLPHGAAALAAAEAAGLLALSADALGAMDVARDMTVEYLRTRRQFGIPIGKFQALQHRVATMLMEVEQARSAVINAADAFDHAAGPSRDRALSAAKYTVGRTGELVAEEAIQMHGGIGMTWELALSHYAKRIIMIDHQLGDQDEHLQRYMALGRAAA